MEDDIEKKSTRKMSESIDDFKNLSKYISEEEVILLACTVNKINKLLVSQKRGLIITNKFIYNLKKKNPLDIFQRTVKRKIALSQISAISLSSYSKNKEIIVHVDSEYDYRYNCGEHRDDIIFTICNAIYDHHVCHIPIYILEELDDMALYTRTEEDMKQGKSICRKTTEEIFLTKEIQVRGMDWYIKNKYLGRKSTPKYQDPESRKGVNVADLVEDIQEIQGHEDPNLPEIHIGKSLSEQLPDQLKNLKLNHSESSIL